MWSDVAQQLVDHQECQDHTNEFSFRLKIRLACKMTRGIALLKNVLFSNDFEQAQSFFYA